MQFGPAAIVPDVFACTRLPRMPSRHGVPADQYDLNNLLYFFVFYIFIEIFQSPRRWRFTS
jgi:hypothetical protein